MRTFTTAFLCLFMCLQVAQAQVYSDHFDNDDPAFMGGSPSYTFGEANSELTATATNTGAFDIFSYQLHDPATGMPLNLDVSGNNKLYVRAKASSVGTQLRIDLQDTTEYVTSQLSLSKTLTTEFMVLEYDFTGRYIDGGFAPPCTSGPCVVDSSVIKALLFYTNPGAGGFTGSIVIDYVSFGQAPDTVITSDIFQDHFEDSLAAETFTFIGGGYSVSQSGTELKISGDGTTAMWDPLTYIFRNPATKDTIDIDITGNNKLFVKVKSSIEGTAFRIDVQDIDSYASTEASITRIVDTTYTILEYDFTGSLNDLGFGGTPCTMSTAPCPVNGSRIADLLFFIEPGVGAFPGVLTIDYISFGVSLEPLGPEPDLIYEDHFNNETLEFTSTNPGFTLEEAGSDLIITGDSTATPFAAISYLLHDKDSANQILLNMEPGGNKLYIKAKVDSGTVPIRIDLIDTTGYITTQPSLTKVINDEYGVYVYDFSRAYADAGFGGTPCMTGPCPVDPAAITQVLIYVDPIQGFFEGEVRIDFLSIGQEAGVDQGPTGLINYADLMDDNTSLFITDPAGLTSVTANDTWTITGDSTGGMWTPILYATHNEIGELIEIDAVGSENKLFIRAKASVDSTELRIDLQDREEYVTNLNAQSVKLGTEYEIYELDYSNAYQDGAFGGSPCTVSGCPVDGKRLKSLQIFVKPGVGLFNGTIDIDWISFGDNTVGIKNPEELQTLRAFPNPVEHRVKVEYTLQKAANIEVRVANMMGQTLLIENKGNQYAGVNSSELNLQQLPTGMYFLQVHTNGKLAGTVRVLKR